MTDKMLLEAAEKARENAYAPYSDFKVGAAILTSGGRVFTGCNVENSSYGGAICAERTAAVKAVSEGEREFTAAAVAGTGEGPTFPCGICRQFLGEFAAEGFRFIFRDKDGNIISYTMDELMPFRFTL